MTAHLVTLGQMTADADRCDSCHAVVVVGVDSHDGGIAADGRELFLCVDCCEACRRAPGVGQTDIFGGEVGA